MTRTPEYMRYLKVRLELTSEKQNQTAPEITARLLRQRIRASHSRGPQHLRMPHIMVDLAGDVLLRKRPVSVHKGP